MPLTKDEEWVDQGEGGVLLPLRPLVSVTPSDYTAWAVVFRKGWRKRNLHPHDDTWRYWDDYRAMLASCLQIVWIPGLLFLAWANNRHGSIVILDKQKFYTWPAHKQTSKGDPYDIVLHRSSPWEILFPRFEPVSKDKIPLLGA